MRMEFTIEGLAELQELMRSKLPDATSKNVLRRAMLKRAEPILNDARSRAPKRTGRLQLSIGEGTRLSARQRQLFHPVDPDDVSVFVGASPLPYAHLVEYGTRHASPHPFMRPAWEAGKQAFADGIRQDIWEEIQKAIARQERRAARKAGSG